MTIIHRLITPAGLIARACTWSLVNKGQKLYLIHTGSAATASHLLGMLEDIVLHPEIPITSTFSRYAKVAQAMQLAYLPAIQKTEQRIEAGDLENLLQTNKKSFVCALGDLSALELKKSGPFAEALLFKAGSRKFKLMFHQTRHEEVSKFFAPLGTLIHS